MRRIKKELLWNVWPFLFRPTFWIRSIINRQLPTARTHKKSQLFRLTDFCDVIEQLGLQFTSVMFFKCVFSLQKKKRSKERKICVCVELGPSHCKKAETRPEEMSRNFVYSCLPLPSTTDCMNYSTTTTTEIFERLAQSNLFGPQIGRKKELKREKWKKFVAFSHTAS